MPWLRARLEERCGSCGGPIAAGDPMFAMFPGGMRGVRRVRCQPCGERLTDTRPDAELADDTTAPQPSFVPIERLPNVVSPGYLQARREAALARLERWRRRHGRPPGGGAHV